jgi:hypothetical protein
MRKDLDEEIYCRLAREQGLQGKTDNGRAFVSDTHPLSQIGPRIQTIIIILLDKA